MLLLSGVVGCVEGKIVMLSIWQALKILRELISHLSHNSFIYITNTVKLNTFILFLAC